MTPCDRRLRTVILDFTVILKDQEITEINAKSSQNAYAMYKFVNFCNSMKNWRKYRKVSKQLIFGQTYLEFVVAIATSKMIDIH